MDGQNAAGVTLPLPLASRGRRVRRRRRPSAGEKLKGHSLPRAELRRIAELFKGYYLRFSRLL